MLIRELSALVVIDVQKGLSNKKMKIFRKEELISNINSLIDAYHDKAMQVYFIRHTNKSMLADILRTTFTGSRG